jgi:hypothetical protein
VRYSDGAHCICSTYSIQKTVKMQDNIVGVAGEVAGHFCKQQKDAFTAQQAIGRGPLMKMNISELQHWMNEICMVVQAAATSKLRIACAKFSAADDNKAQLQHFSVCTSMTSLVCWLC